MKKTTGICWAILCSTIFGFIHCNDTSDSALNDSVSPSLSSNTVIKSYRKIDQNILGDPITTPENFVEIFPVNWNGVSEFEMGVRYRIAYEQFDKLAKLAENDVKWQNILNELLAIRDGSLISKKEKGSGPKLASVYTSATCSGAYGGMVYGEAWATGPNTNIALVDIDGGWVEREENEGWPVQVLLSCWGECEHCYAGANDGNEFMEDRCAIFW